MGELTQFSPRLQPLLSVILVPHSLLKRDLLLKKSSSNPTFNFLPFARRRTSRRALLWGAVKPKPSPSFPLTIFFKIAPTVSVLLSSFTLVPTVSVLLYITILRIYKYIHNLQHLLSASFSYIHLVTVINK